MKLRALLSGWAPTIVFGIVLPIVTYNVLTGRGVSEVTALVVASGWAAADLLVYFVLHRRLDEFALIILTMLLLSAVGALVFHSTTAIFAKDSVITGLFGVACLVSLLLPRPMMFYFGRKFATGGTAAGVAQWNDAWDRFPGFRTGNRRLTVVWGVTYVAEAAVRLALIPVLPTATMLTVSTVLPWVVLAGLIAYTMRASRQGQARLAAARAAEQPTAA
ncbi:VC0807 family protein [Krasilnikovia sp. M28-CT-15]|uniref:VC0807 family protein n=1 Tax=Krasilnikovia sp. M28-CT-15 TaxID=3373540 RepID=UPI00387785BD